MIDDRLDPDVAARYLDLLGVDPASVAVDVETLARLQLAHLRTVPFENLDVFWRRPVTVDLSWSVPKVTSGRGGWCFELNGAFGTLLATLGFDVDRVAARVLMAQTPSPMEDHLCTIVHLDRDWLVDVGFGESFTSPLALDDPDPVDDPIAGCRFRLVERDGARLLQSEREGTWRDDYSFELVPRPLQHFEPANDHLRLTEGLMWTQKRFVTRLADDGRITLLEDRFTHHRTGADDTVTPIEDADHWSAVLADRFGYDPAAVDGGP